MKQLVGYIDRRNNRCGTCVVDNTHSVRQMGNCAQEVDINKLPFFKKEGLKYYGICHPLPQKTMVETREGKMVILRYIKKTGQYLVNEFNGLGNHVISPADLDIIFG